MDQPLVSNQYPGNRYAWFMVVMLTLAYILSYVDRYVLGLLVEPIKADLGLTDTQIGILMGPAFGVVYATMGLPLGWLADHKRRTLIVAAGVALWSFATAATGLAKNFMHVFIARMSVGVGEAALNPCTMSMISDSFPPERRGKPIAFYTGALSLGAGIASLIAAGVLTWAKTVPEIELGYVGVLAPWQLIFIIVGVPGILLSLVFLVLREPPRIKREDEAQKEKSGLIAMLAYVKQRSRAYLGITSLFGCMVIVAYSQGWMAASFERTWGWSAEQYVFVNAIVLLALGPATVNFSGWLSDYLFKKGRRDSSYQILLVGVAILMPTGIAATLMPSGELAFVFLALNTIGIAMVTAVGPATVLNITPGHIRAQAIALFYMVVSLAGLVFGPLTVSLLSDYVFGNENLNYAVSAVPFIFGIPGLLYGFYARSAYLQELDSFKS